MAIPNPHTDIRAFAEWSRKMTGLVVLPTSMVGSGVFVKHPNGYPAFLTAIHVVMPALLKGEFAIAMFWPAGAILSPTAIRFARGTDAALLSLEGQDLPAMIDFPEWGALNYSDASGGDTVFCIGYPGELSTRGDLATKQRGAVVGVTLAAVVQPKPVQRLIHGTIQRLPDLPSSFGGMSGGPVVSADGRLLGINTSESQDNPDVADIFYTRRRDWQDLASPYIAKVSPNGYLSYRQQKGFGLQFRHPSTRKVMYQFNATVFGRVVTLGDSPENATEGFGIIDRMEIAGSRFPINVEASYPLSDLKDPAQWEVEFGMECSKVLGTMGLEAV